MSINLTSPITGGAQTGLTSPTYTMQEDSAPNTRSKQWAVTSLGGTQTGVDTHTNAKPFTVAFMLPSQFKALPAANPVTGIRKGNPKNTTKIVVRKGVLPSSTDNPQLLIARIELEVPAGADNYDPEDIRAAVSLLVGTLNQQSSEIGDLLITGIL